MKKVIICMLSLMVPFCIKASTTVFNEESGFVENAKSAILIEQSTGQILYEKNSHEVVPVEKCFIEDEKSGQIIQTIRKLCKSFKIKTYDEDTGYGLLRHVLVRSGYHTGEYMVVLVLGSPIMPSKNNFVKALLTWLVMQ